MPGFVLHVGAVVTCSHAGPANPVAPFPRVTVAGNPVVTLSSPYAVTGCALTGSPNPPCATGQWLNGAVRVTAGGAPLVINTGSSTCIPTGTPLLPMSQQPRVQAS